MTAKTFRLALFGGGRIGRVHAQALRFAPSIRLATITDPFAENADFIAQTYGADIRSEDEVFADDSIDAVAICSATNTHADLIERAARAGKAIFCEKPIDLSLARVDQCAQTLRDHPVHFLVGFNRRYDPQFMALEARVRGGMIGDVEQVIITSRDPGAPPIDYIKVSGGLFRDMMIHDFDVARWLLGEEPVELFARGANLVDPAIGAAGDIDTATVVMTCASGRQAAITNSRRAAYGYDQRLEVHGATGMLQANNVHESTVMASTSHGVAGDKPLHFFLERYAQAYEREWTHFEDMLVNGTPARTSVSDGRISLAMAEAALRSMQENRPVKISEFDA